MGWLTWDEVVRLWEVPGYFWEVPYADPATGDYFPVTVIMAGTMSVSPSLATRLTVSLGVANGS